MVKLFSGQMAKTISGEMWPSLKLYIRMSFYISQSMSAKKENNDLVQVESQKT